VAPRRADVGRGTGIRKAYSLRMSHPKLPLLPVIRGERVYLRAPERSDIPTFVRWFNGRARRSYEKSGFVLEGTERHAIFKRGRYYDVHLMSILREEWAALPRRKMWDYDDG